MEIMHRKIQRRTALVLTFCTLGIVALGGRLAYIQFSAHDMQGHDLVASAVEQRREKFELDSGRGDILDRHGASLTGSKISGIVVLPVWQHNLERPKINELALLLNTSTEHLLAALQEKTEPFLLRLPDMSGNKRVVKLTPEQSEKVRALNLTGIYAKEVKVRYDDLSLARHTVGFLGEDPNLVANTWGGKYPLDEQIGKMGLEFQYQEELRGLGISRTIAYYSDNAARPINGLGIRESTEQNPSLSVKTTLDHDIQRSVEQAMDRYGMNKAAVIVLDAETEDVLAMSSRPNYDQTKPVDGDQYPVNRALKANFPGSIFKAVIAQAALETGVVSPTDRFECPGYIEIGDGRLNCWTKHGTVTAEQAFAESCNVAFAQMAMKLGRAEIDTYAKKFGLGAAVGMTSGAQSQFYGEDPGSVFLKEGSSDRFLANTGIGQEDVRTTPLQAAHLMAIFANNGMAREPRLVQSLHTPDGLLYKDFDTAERKQVIDRQAAYQVKKWMREVVASPDGTAHILSKAQFPVAGKTGTAQTGDPNANHQWFAGFGPVDKPKYVVVVMAESATGTRATEQVALQIFNALPNP
ncbi:cell division protein FtsI/penicillin-binding protein 2 [Tumebacillus sp. BK434]|uniref:peptidoglycan D,D-transpeptidase FtsI family protein n=1 Tax=Tumebacillus sp. BK434 TaxID=2512169 RepID=UPI0010484BA2|nr:penicillin-binding protein 2 [Tumebacillus sp. BK434]TCP54569.1 cell division protein FtsI/penicillin-binding protein 2 [Tumebacillus sp. BK434]